MAFRFNHKKAVHTMLFALHSLGRKADPERLFLLLYLADVKHLAKYGSFILGDTYVAMKHGPAPFHTMGIYRELRENNESIKSGPKTTIPLSINEQHQLVARESYNTMALSESEVECLFETMHLYKTASFELLSHITSGEAWKKAEMTGELSLTDIAIENSASPEMIARIERSHNSEINKSGN